VPAVVAPNGDVINTDASDASISPAGILYPAILPAPVPPGNHRAGSTGDIRNTPESDLGGGTISLPPGPVGLPPGPVSPPPGTVGLPPGPAAIPPGAIPNSTSAPGVPPPIVSPPPLPGQGSR
jgi:hypothetical protein